MVINEIKVAESSDVSKYAWAGLARYMNSEFVKREICRLHGLPVRHERNALSQADEIRHCLSQASEYSAAAKTVSLATRPVLLYYSCMSLALAEILFKQSADSRLSKLRQHHNCHGLQMMMSESPRIATAIEESGAALRAKMQTDGTGNARGTFEVWRRSAREYPVGGLYTKHLSSVSRSESFESYFGPSDEPFAQIQAHGITLLTCLRNIPSLEDTLRRLGTSLDMVRATFSREKGLGDPYDTWSLIVHPQNQSQIDAFAGCVIADASSVNYLAFEEFPLGFSIRKPGQFGENFRLSLPHGTALTDKYSYFHCSRSALNEFGYIYVALHICGNFARYYPDVWLSHIQKCSDLSIAVNSLCETAVDRLPLLTLSELSRQFQIFKS